MLFRQILQASRKARQIKPEAVDNALVSFQTRLNKAQEKIKQLPGIISVLVNRAIGDFFKPEFFPQIKEDINALVKALNTPPKNYPNIQKPLQILLKHIDAPIGEKALRAELAVAPNGTINNAINTKRGTTDLDFATVISAFVPWFFKKISIKNLDKKIEPIITAIFNLIDVLPQGGGLNEITALEKTIQDFLITKRGEYTFLHFLRQFKPLVKGTFQESLITWLIAIGEGTVSLSTLSEPVLQARATLFQLLDAPETTEAQLEEAVCLYDNALCTLFDTKIENDTLKEALTALYRPLKDANPGTLFLAPYIKDHFKDKKVDTTLPISVAIKLLQTSDIAQITPVSDTGITSEETTPASPQTPQETPPETPRPEQTNPKQEPVPTHPLETRLLSPKPEEKPEPPEPHPLQTTLDAFVKKTAWIKKGFEINDAHGLTGLFKRIIQGLRRFFLNTDIKKAIRAIQQATPESLQAVVNSAYQKFEKRWLLPWNKKILKMIEVLKDNITEFERSKQLAERLNQEPPVIAPPIIQKTPAEIAVLKLQTAAQELIEKAPLEWTLTSDLGETLCEQACSVKNLAKALENNDFSQVEAVHQFVKMHQALKTVPAALQKEIAKLKIEEKTLLDLKQAKEQAKAFLEQETPLIQKVGKTYQEKISQLTQAILYDLPKAIESCQATITTNTLHQEKIEKRIQAFPQFIQNETKAVFEKELSALREKAAVYLAPPAPLPQL